MKLKRYLGFAFAVAIIFCSANMIALAQEQPDSSVTLIENTLEVEIIRQSGKVETVVIDMGSHYVATGMEAPKRPDMPSREGKSGLGVAGSAVDGNGSIAYVVCRQTLVEDNADYETKVSRTFDWTIPSNDYMNDNFKINLYSGDLVTFRFGSTRAHDVAIGLYNWDTNEFEIGGYSWIPGPEEVLIEGTMLISNTVTASFALYNYDTYSNTFRGSYSTP